MQAQATRIIHAYKQAPWRVQRQYIGAFMLIVIALSLIAALYLDLSARTTLAGREIQELQIDITTMQRTNADLETELANLTASNIMRSRALELGYRPVKPGEIDYVFVTGYTAPDSELALEAIDTPLYSQALPSEYSQSLIEWFDQQFQIKGIIQQ